MPTSRAESCAPVVETSSSVVNLAIFAIELRSPARGRRALASSPAVLAQLHPPVKVGTKISVRPEVAPSAAEQTSRARQRIASLSEIADQQQRFTAMLEIMTNLSVVGHKWPQQTDAVLESAVVQADLALQYSMPRNAVEVLDAVLSKSHKTTYHVTIERALARAYDKLGGHAAVEAHLLAAERSPMIQKANRFVDSRRDEKPNNGIGRIQLAPLLRL